MRQADFGESIAALRALDTPLRLSEKPVELTLPKFSPPLSADKETHKLLAEQNVRMEETRPLLIRAAELIQTLTDTALATQAAANDNAAQAERHAKRSLWIAIASIVVSLFVSCISIYYARMSPTAEQVSLLAKGFEEKINSSIANAKQDREAFEKSAAADRAAFSTEREMEEARIKELSERVSRIKK